MGGFRCLLRNLLHNEVVNPQKRHNQSMFPCRKAFPAFYSKLQCSILRVKENLLWKKPT